MPNPKRRHSKSRRDKRRTHYKAEAASFGLWQPSASAAASARIEFRVIA